jgi:diaminopimelate epimerase
MKIKFYKYQGTGNDFILFDNRNKDIFLTTEQIKWLCGRRFGIGADGLMLLELEPGFDFKMVYFNSDGNQSSMCGNGGRCIAALAKHLGLVKEKCKFLAIDGPHEALVNPHTVSLKMMDVKEVEKNSDHYYLNTGSPHYVKAVSDIENFDVVGEGKKIRYNERFFEQGTNVNFIEKKDDSIFVRTYERGVEGETYSCGTGVTAAALVAGLEGMLNTKNTCAVKTLGGELEVKFEKVLDSNFYNIWLVGPAELVFTGEIEIKE